MRGILLILSVVAMVMTADAYSVRSDKSWADIQSKLRLAELYEQIVELEEAAAKRSPGSNVGRIPFISLPGPGNSEQEKRSTNFFNRLNAIPDLPEGKITMQDFDAILLLVNTVEGSTPGRVATIRSSVQAAWESSFKNQATSLDHWKVTLNNMISGNTFKAWADTVFRVFFQVVDVNGDNQLSKDEFIKVYIVLFLNPIYAANCYDGMNTDGNSYLSLAEYYDYAYGYFVIANTQDNSRYFWGEY